MKKNVVVKDLSKLFILILFLLSFIISYNSLSDHIKRINDYQYNYYATLEEREEYHKASVRIEKYSIIQDVVSVICFVAALMITINTAKRKKKIAFHIIFTVFTFSSAVVLILMNLN